MTEGKAWCAEQAAADNLCGHPNIFDRRLDMLLALALRQRRG